MSRLTGVWLTGVFTLADSAQVIGLLVLVATFLAVGFSRNKDATIKTWRENAEAEAARADRLEEDVQGLQQRADREHEKRVECQERAAKLEGQLAELRPYGEAFRQLSSRIERTESVLGTAMEQQGALIMENTAVASQSVKALERVSEDLKTNQEVLAAIKSDFSLLAERLGAGGDRPIGSV